jgi:hypothetical protein
MHEADQGPSWTSEVAEQEHVLEGAWDHDIRRWLKGIGGEARL